MGKQVKSPQQSSQNWQQAMSAPATAQKYSAGIDRVTQSPMEQAASAAAMQLYLQRVQDAVTSGRRERALRNADFNVWKTQAKGVGAAGLARGAQKGQGKVQAHFQKWAPIYQQASDAAQSLPKGGFAAAQARWSASTQVLMSAAGRA